MTPVYLSSSRPLLQQAKDSCSRKIKSTDTDAQLLALTLLPKAIASSILLV